MVGDWIDRNAKRSPEARAESVATAAMCIHSSCMERAGFRSSEAVDRVDRATMFSIPGGPASRSSRRSAPLGPVAVRFAAHANGSSVGDGPGPALARRGHGRRRRQRVRHGRHAPNPARRQEARHAGVAGATALGTRRAFRGADPLARTTGIRDRRKSIEFVEPAVED